jgi:hypothetical protein
MQPREWAEVPHAAASGTPIGTAQGARIPPCQRALTVPGGRGYLFRDDSDARHAVRVRYPGSEATAAEMKKAHQDARAIRQEARAALGL